MRAEQQQPQRFRFMALEDFVDDDLVAQTLGHLLQFARVGIADLVFDLAGLRADPHQAIVHPVTGEWLPRIRFRLRQLVLVVWKREVESAAVNVQRLAEESHTHGRAFNVPARPARSPGTVPFRLTRLGCLPQGKIPGITFLVADLDTGPGLQLLRITVAQFAIVGVRADIEVDIASCWVGMSFVDETLNEGNHVPDVVRSPGQIVDADDSEPLQVLAIIRRHALGHCLPRGVLEPPPV